LIVAKTPGAMAACSARWRASKKTVGLVPTMGALHEGHASLIRRARKDCDKVAVSIFVNPAQFGPNEDYTRYPRTFAADQKLCAQAGADAIYAPAAGDVYPEGFKTDVEVGGGLSTTLEGAVRPGHFKGVATVVLKLFNAASPHLAYFGEKDWQQLQVIRTMARDLDLPIKIIGCPIIREKDGLALSSRNRYLSAPDRAKAGALYQSLKTGSPQKARALLEAVPGLSIDYLALVDADTLKEAGPQTRRRRFLGAVRLGGTRLIDNVPVP
jgi:pantoate--beta-alanine ligase